MATRGTSYLPGKSEGHFSKISWTISSKLPDSFPGTIPSPNNSSVKHFKPRKLSSTNLNSCQHTVFAHMSSRIQSMADLNTNQIYICSLIRNLSVIKNQKLPGTTHSFRYRLRKWTKRSTLFVYLFRYRRVLEKYHSFESYTERRVF